MSNLPLLSYDNSMFLSLEDCREALVEFDILREKSLCSKCGSETELKVYKKVNNNSKLLYRCVSKICHEKKVVFKGSRLSLHKVMFVVYLIVLKCTYVQIIALTGVSEKFIRSTKRSVREIFKKIIKKMLIMGGPGVEIQVYETVLCRNGVIRSPTSTDDNHRDTVWILGVINPRNKNDIM